MSVQPGSHPDSEQGTLCMKLDGSASSVWIALEYCQAGTRPSAGMTPHIDPGECVSRFPDDAPPSGCLAPGAGWRLPRAGWHCRWSTSGACRCQSTGVGAAWCRCRTGRYCAIQKGVLQCGI